MKNPISLFDIEERYDAALRDALENPDVDFADTLEAIDGELEEKRKAVGYFLRNLEGAAKLRRDEAKRMLDRARTLERQHEQLTNYLIRSMHKHEITSVACPEFELALKQNPARVAIDDEGSIPMMDGLGIDLMKEKTTYTPDKKAIKAAINRGEAVPGAHLERGWRLEVK